MNYGNIKNCDPANGHGVRVSLFVSGCRNHCVGCFQPQTWDFNYGKPYTKDVEDMIISMCDKSYINGLSILGGEPFEPENQRVLVGLIRRFKEAFPNKNIWMWSGYSFDLDMKPEGKVYTEVTDEILSLIDVLVDGRFDITLKLPEGKSFRGSSNQRIINVKETLKSKQIVVIDNA